MYVCMYPAEKAHTHTCPHVRTYVHIEMEYKHITRREKNGERKAIHVWKESMYSNSVEKGRKKVSTWKSVSVVLHSGEKVLSFFSPPPPTP